MTDNRVALVTGANKGIRLEIARQAADTGVSIVIGARDPDRAQAAVETLAAAGLQANSVPIPDAGDVDRLTTLLGRPLRSYRDYTVQIAG